MASMTDKATQLGDWTAVVRGGGDLGTGVIYRLHRAGLRVVVTELPSPLVIRRTVALATAVFQGMVEVEGVVGRLVTQDREISAAWEKSEVPVLIDPDATVVSRLRTTVLIDAIMAKKNLGTRIDAAPIVIALGPGFVAGTDCHAVVETQRGHYLGRAIYNGAAAPDSRVPGLSGGLTSERVLRTSAAGRFHAVCEIGDRVQAGQVVAWVNDRPISTAIDGVVRGMLADESIVDAGLKVGDVDPRGNVQYCFHISDKALSIGGGVLEAILFLGRQKGLL